MVKRTHVVVLVQLRRDKGISQVLRLMHSLNDSGWLGHLKCVIAVQLMKDG